MNASLPKGPDPLLAVRPHTPTNPSESLPANGVFLHTGWRSSGTWLWSRCREQPNVHAFYEPLHEAIATLRRSDIPKLRPSSWRSNHGETEPYFAEFGKLIAPRRAGVPAYQRRFAFDGFFLEPGEDDPALEAYLRGLLATAAGQVAVLKFCRSLGRVGWMEQRFPDMLHAVVLRDPMEQWRSARRLLIEERNRYFTLAPLLVLARNPAHPLVRQACQALDVRLPVLGSPDMAYGVETVWRFVRHQDVLTQYRGFLAYWTASALAALQSRALLIDTALLARAPEHRAAVEAAFAARLGAPIDLSYQTVKGSDLAGPAAGDVCQAHADASAFVRAAGGALAARRLAKLLGCLATPGETATPRAVAVQAPSAWAELPQAVIRLGAWQRALLAVQVVFARALQPLRRLHGEMTRRA